MNVLAPSPTPKNCGIAVLAVVTLVIASCSVDRHYKTLSFFFDGVPNPADRPLVQQGPPPPKVDWNALAPEERNAQLKYTLPKQKIYNHKPYADRQCIECHQFEENKSGSSWMVGLPTLLAPKEELCKKCHGAPETKYVHGPVGASRCDICHEQHQSRYAHLVKTADSSTLCVQCHSGEVFTTREEHADFYESACVKCHDPHGTDTEHLLKPGWQALAYGQGPKPSPDTTAPEERAEAK